VPREREREGEAREAEAGGSGYGVALGTAPALVVLYTLLFTLYLPVTRYWAQIVACDRQHVTDWTVGLWANIPVSVP
jgi:hypothetical protein